MTRPMFEVMKYNSLSKKKIILREYANNFNIQKHT
jgi:hypothetical protein